MTNSTQQIIKAIEAEPLTRLKSNSYDHQLVEAVKQDVIKLIQKLDEILAK